MRPDKWGGTQTSGSFCSQVYLILFSACCGLARLCHPFSAFAFIMNWVCVGGERWRKRRLWGSFWRVSVFTLLSSCCVSGIQMLSVQPDTKPKGCAGCNRKIKDRYLLKALDKYWHEDCLKCACCDCRLGEVGSTLYTKANLILCRRDYLR